MLSLNSKEELLLLLLLLSRFSRVRLCATPQTPPSLGFSRQEHWSGLPFPSPVRESEMWKWSRSVMSDFSRPHGLQPTRLLRPWDFPGKSTGGGCHCLPRKEEQAPIIRHNIWMRVWEIKCLNQTSQATKKETNWRDDEFTESRGSHRQQDGASS